MRSTPALTGSLKPTVMSLPAPTPPAPLTGLVDVTAGAESVVKLKVWSAAGWSGASTVSVSLIRAARAVTVQVVPAGSAEVGVSVIVWPGEPLTVNACCEDAGHASVNAFVRRRHALAERDDDPGVRGDADGAGRRLAAGHDRRPVRRYDREPELGPAALAGARDGAQTAAARGQRRRRACR